MQSLPVCLKRISRKSYFLHSPQGLAFVLPLLCLYIDFNLRHPPIRDMEIKTLCRYYQSPFVTEQLQKMSQKMGEGSLTHGSDIFGSLLAQLKP